MHERGGSALASGDCRRLPLDREIRSQDEDLAPLPGLVIPYRDKPSACFAL
jgi:hypothetical protein